MIPNKIKIKKDSIPDKPGVYLYYNKTGALLYVGKATSLRNRVNSYFTKPASDRIAEMVLHIARIEYITTPTVIEALILEANQIKAKKPKYNILQRDDKSFLYLAITNEPFPRPTLIRGHELEHTSSKNFLKVFGPYTSSASLKKALDIIRKAIPWSECQPPEVTGRTRPCFYSHIGKCPGVCIGSISKKDYRAIIRQLILFFEGKKKEIIRQIERDMKLASKELRFEKAAELKRHLFALEHIQDIALISKDDIDNDSQGRIEAYDISNISGTSAVGSMVVFEEGKPSKKQYRKFKIKTVKGSNDVAMLEEVLRRRLLRAKNFPNAWSLPQVIIIDGGEGQVNRARKILEEMNIIIPVVGIAKGFDRKQDRFVFDHTNLELLSLVNRKKELLQRARDEAHRFAVQYHRKLRDVSR
ncbi:excinuclease ABC subunit UvrC [Candidatus Uhrbacteria bacterium]|nr:excinuclease ABC subunit UvrC [Candidatus Uhrbacteria bacterium]